MYRLVCGRAVRPATGSKGNASRAFLGPGANMTVKGRPALRGIVVIEARLRNWRGAETSVWFRALFHYSPTGLFVTDFDGTIKIANDAALALGGYDRRRRRVAA